MNELLVKMMAAAMEKKRAELIGQPLARIWEQLAAAALVAVEGCGYDVVVKEGWIEEAPGDVLQAMHHVLMKG